MKKSSLENIFIDRHTVSMEPEKMDRFSAEDGLFAGQPEQRQIAVWDAIERMPNARYRQVLTGLYCERRSPELLAAEMGVSLPNFYNLHRRALNQLRTLLNP